MTTRSDAHMVKDYFDKFTFVIITIVLAFVAFFCISLHLMQKMPVGDSQIHKIMLEVEKVPELKETVSLCLADGGISSYEYKHIMWKSDELRREEAQAELHKILN